MITLAEYIENGLQTINLGSSITFNSSIPCTRGFVFHEDGSGIFILKGITNNCFARYEVTFNGNISTSGDLTPIAVAITENGEVRQESLAIFTPQAVDEFGNVTSTCTITVPKGCCFTVAVRYVSGITDGETTPTPTINVQNASLRISRTA